MILQPSVFVLWVVFCFLIFLFFFSWWIYKKKITRPTNMCFKNMRDKMTGITKTKIWTQSYCSPVMSFGLFWPTGSAILSLSLANSPSLKERDANLHIFFKPAAHAASHGGVTLTAIGPFPHTWSHRLQWLARVILTAWHAWTLWCSGEKLTCWTANHFGLDFKSHHHLNCPQPLHCIKRDKLWITAAAKCPQWVRGR